MITRSHRTNLVVILLAALSLNTFCSKDLYEPIYSKPFESNVVAIDTVGVFPPDTSENELLKGDGKPIKLKICSYPVCYDSDNYNEWDKETNTLKNSQFHIEWRLPSELTWEEGWRLRSCKSIGEYDFLVSFHANYNTKPTNNIFEIIDIDKELFSEIGYNFTIFQCSISGILAVKGILEPFEWEPLCEEELCKTVGFAFVAYHNIYELYIDCPVYEDPKKQAECDRLLVEIIKGFHIDVNDDSDVMFAENDIPQKL